MAHRGDGPLAHRAVEDDVVLELEPGRVHDVALVGDVLDDRLDHLLLVAQGAQRARDGAVDDLHRRAADQLLELHQREVGLQAGGVAVHHQTDRAGRGDDGGLRVAVAVLLAERQALLPRLGGLVQDPRVVRADRTQGVVGGGVLAHDPLVRVGVAGVAVVRTDDRGQLGRALVSGAGHQAGDRASQRTAAVAVVGVAGRHQQGAEVGVADTELAVGPGGLADRDGREVGEADRDVHRGDDQLDRLGEPGRVERAVVAQELHQVERGQVARGVVQGHVLAARVGGGDPAGLRVGVPVVDRVVVLDTRVGALPGGGGQLAPQLLGVDGLEHLAVAPGAQAEAGALLDGAHELVTDPDRVVGVLVLDADDVLAAEVHVEAGVAQRADLVLLARLGLDELHDVGVVHVQDDHLGRAAGGAAGLDGAGGGVRAAHEGDRAGRGAAGGQQLLGGADQREVQAGAGATLEDQPLLAVPVQDRVHRVVHREDEARGDLLGRGGADVEPDRAVEREHLVQQHPGQLVLEQGGVLVGGEVVVLPAGRAVLVHDPADQLLERPLAVVRADGAAEVLGGDDVGGVDRPGLRELHPALLEVDRAVAPVGHDDVTTLPDHLVVRVLALGRPEPLDLQALDRLALRPPNCAAHCLRHAVSSSSVVHRLW